MSYSESLDHLVFNKKYFPEYNGHHCVEVLQVMQDCADGTPSKPNARLDASGWSSTQCSEWLLRPTKWVVTPKPIMNILLIGTHNQLTAKLAERQVGEQQIAGANPRTAQRVEQAQFLLEVFSNTQLPMAGLASYVKTLTTFAAVPPRSVDGFVNSSYAYYCSGPSWCVSWAYSPTTKVTSAVLLYREGDGQKRVKEAVQELHRLRNDVDHPMLLGYIRTKISIALTFRVLLEMNLETKQLEKDSGLPTWDWALEHETEGHDPPETHDRSINRFSVLSGKTTNMRFRLRALQEQIKFIVRCNKRHQQLIRKDTDAVQKCKDLHEMMQVMTEYTAVYLFDADSLAERLTNQMTSIFNLTSQKDSRAGIAIAKDSRKLAVQSKRDSSSMKTIAVVTLFFLPGTFVAAFFATPMFNWDASSNDLVVSPRFWVFWAVSVPLTAGVCLSWILWYRHRGVVQLREEKMEQQELGNLISGRRRNSSISKVRSITSFRKYITLGRRPEKAADEESGQRQAAVCRKVA